MKQRETLDEQSGACKQYEARSYFKNYQGVPGAEVSHWGRLKASGMQCEPGFQA